MPLTARRSSLSSNTCVGFFVVRAAGQVSGTDVGMLAPDSPLSAGSQWFRKWGQPRDRGRSSENLSRWSSRIDEADLRRGIQTVSATESYRRRKHDSHAHRAEQLDAAFFVRRISFCAENGYRELICDALASASVSRDRIFLKRSDASASLFLAGWFLTARLIVSASASRATSRTL